MAWNDYVSTDLDSGDSVPTGQGAWLVENDRTLAEIPMPVEFTDQTTTSATYVTLTTFPFISPDYGDSAFYLYLQPDVYVSAGTGTFRIKTAANDGTEVSVTNTGSHSDASSGSKVLIETANTLHTITVEGKVTGGNTLHVQMVDRMTCWMAGS